MPADSSITTLTAKAPIVILSGGPGVGGKQEDDLAAELGKKYRCIILDQRGTGHSWVKPMDEKTINLETALADLETLRKHLNLDRIAISGHSWGAMLAAAYAQKYPERLTGLLFIGGGELSYDRSAIINEAIHYRRNCQDSTAYAHWNSPEVKQAEPQKSAAALKRLAWKSYTYDQKKLDMVLLQANHGTYNGEMGKLMWKDLTSKKFDFSKQTFAGPVLVVLDGKIPSGP